MATRRYCSRGPSDRDLQRFVQQVAKVVNFGTGCVDVEIDDSIEGAVETVDEYMASVGFVFDQKAPPVETEVLIKSPDGSTYAVAVDNAGVLSATKKP